MADARAAGDSSDRLLSTFCRLRFERTLIVHKLKLEFETELPTLILNQFFNKLKIGWIVHYLSCKTVVMTVRLGLKLECIIEMLANRARNVR